MKKLLLTSMLLSLLAVSSSFAGEKECQRELMNARSNHGIKSTEQSYSSMSGNTGDVDSLNLNRFLRLKKQLALTPEQLDSLEDLRLELRKDTLDKHSEIRKTRSELNALLRNPTPDFPAIKEKVETINSLQLEIKTSTIDTYEQAYNLLDSTQKAAFADWLSGGKHTQK